MAISNYQSNVIKQVYGNEIINQSHVSSTEVENYYKYNAHYNNSIESPDLLTNVASYHGFSPYPLTFERTELLDEEQISKIRIPQDIVDSHSAYFKILNEKDIDWENAYLKYSGDYQTCEPEKKIEYVELSTTLNGDKIQLNSTPKENNEYLFKRGITSYVNSTYELLNIIDYLLARIKALYFLYDVVKNQSIVMNNYKDQLAKINS